jgi:hypothetical protein
LGVPLDVLLADLLALGAGTASFVWAMRNLARGHRNSLLLVIVAFDILFIAPLILDITYRIPGYVEQPGFALAVQDKATELTYDGLVLWVSALFWVFARVRVRRDSLVVRVESAAIDNRLASGFDSYLPRFLLWIIIVSPVAVTAMAPNPSEFLTYAASARGLIVGQNISYEHVLTFVTIGSVIASALFVLTSRVLSAAVLSVSPFLVADAWVQGKRSIVLITLVLFGFVFLRRGRLAGIRLPLAFFAGLLFVAVFSSTYQHSLRANPYQYNPHTYDDIRTDFGRDGVTKQTLYALVHPKSRQILEHAGQSVIYDLTFFVPRSQWSDKPYPYSVYVTSAMLDIPVQSLGWGVTTSLIEEMIANFGWWGMLVGPLLLILMCRAGDSFESEMLTALTGLVACLLLAVQFSAISALVLVWLGSIIVLRVRGRGRVSEPSQSILEPNTADVSRV